MTPAPDIQDHLGTECPPQATLNELAQGQLSSDTAATLRAHVVSCPRCSVLLVGLGETAAEPSAKPEAMAQPGQFVAEFQLVRALGQGAMGQVFLAQDTFLDRPVAIKFLTASDSTTVARERFFIEARAVARLQHPNVVTLYRAGEEQGRRYLVSEYVSGKSLERWQKPLPWRQVLDIGLGLSRGLAVAHQRGVLHRDIKPANAIVTEQGDVKLLDFGLAKLVGNQPEVAEPSEQAQLPPSVISVGRSEAGPAEELSLTKSGTLLGTPLYMAPETWRGRPATAQADVYSLGAMLYELCTGRPPHRAETLAALGARVAGSNPTPLLVVASSVDARLAAVIDRCLQRDPAKRFASAEQVREALERIATRSSYLSRRVAAVGVSLVLVLFAILAGVTVVRDRQAKRQAALSQQLGQQIKDMEWLLRSARQLPLHDLNREKSIVRKRMAQLEAEMLGYGAIGRGLAHYALGRGHLALHEYPQALSELEQAMQLGYKSADAYHALGLVLGLHYKQAKAELRDMGPPSWVKKRLQPYESRYLTPAIAALKRSREMKLDAPQYLEGLIAFYQGDYDAALRHAQAAQLEAPWLYEAATLSAEIYMERSAYARLQGSGDFADRELVNATRSYEAATSIGQSDAEVYENLTAVWTRRIYFASLRRQPIPPLYEAAIAASDKSIRAEPDSILSRLKRTQAAIYSLPLLEGNVSTAERLKECRRSAEEVLQRQPAQPVASHFAAVCLVLGAALAGQRGEDQEPLLRQAANQLEALVRRDPSYFNAANDLSIAYSGLAELLLSHGSPEAKQFLDKGQEYAHKTADLDDVVYWSLYSAQRILALRLSLATSEQEIQSLLTPVDAEFARIKQHNPRDTHAHEQYVWAYATASYRTLMAGRDPRPLLKQALGSLAQARALGNSTPDLESSAILIHYVDASSRVQAKQDPGPALAQLEESLKHCLAMAAQDATCQTAAVGAGWVESEWLAQQKQPTAPALRRALQRAIEATQSPEQKEDAWQALAEARLRLYLDGNTTLAGSHLIAEGLAAVHKSFAVNPNYALGLATQGSLLLARAQAERDQASRQKSAQEAVTALAKALTSDPILEHRYAASLDAARALAQRAAP